MRKVLLSACAVIVALATTTTATAEDLCPDRVTVGGGGTVVLDVAVPCQQVEPVLEPLREIGDWVGFPPAGFAVTAVAWSMTPPQVVPSFTPPVGTASHPSNWSCTLSFPSLTTARAECTPLDPPDPGTSGWACYDPFVDVNISTPRAAPSAVTGTSSCGTSVATCTASTGPLPAGHCSNWAFPQQPVPLVCEADWGAALAVSTWSVRCAPIDP